MIDNEMHNETDNIIIPSKITSDPNLPPSLSPSTYYILREQLELEKQDFESHTDDLTSHHTMRQWHLDECL